jgi:hypothetical protein
MSCDHPDYAQFKTLWAGGHPVVVTGVQHIFQGRWTPQYFMERFGSERVTVVDCETTLERKSTVADFFESFGSERSEDPEGKKILKLKVCFPGRLLQLLIDKNCQDWPPQNNFRNVFPELYAAFIDAIPFPDFARPDGVCNLASHFAHNGVIPDLGMLCPCQLITYSH